MSATATSAFETARDFAEHGLPVFPVHTVADGVCSCGKKACDRRGNPRTPNGLDDASTDERVLLAWNDRWPDANYGGWAASTRSLTPRMTVPRSCEVGARRVDLTESVGRKHLRQRWHQHDLRIALGDFGLARSRVM